MSNRRAVTARNKNVEERAARELEGGLWGQLLRPSDDTYDAARKL